MAKQNRKTLTNFFKDGSLPSAAQFGELIDSMLNKKDEGFNKSAEHGFEITTLDQSTGLISFFLDSQPLVPLWSIRLSEQGQQDLLFTSSPETAAHPVLTGETEAAAATDPTLALKSNGFVGVNTATPECDLDVNGTVRSSTRLGVGSLRQLDDASAAEKAVPADGEWHSITPALEGCQALEVVAGAGGDKGTGHYAMLHAIALNSFNPRGCFFNFLGLKNRIKCRHSYHRSRSEKLALRWYVENPADDNPEQKYFLQIKSKTHYEEKKRIWINYHITNLWTDPLMAQSLATGAGK